MVLNVLFEHPPRERFWNGPFRKLDKNAHYVYLGKSDRRRRILMEPKQLANILIKILGLYFFLNGVFGLAAFLPTSILMGAASLTSLTLITVLANLLPNALQIVFSIILIAKCKKITRFLFRDETGQSS